jgi:2-polyprenyl-3-methyl-5-hydroxy-6-metoxy-1,4-benzoquinol methylase
MAPDFGWARALSDAEWREALATSAYGDKHLPANPSASIQERYVGSSGAAAYLEAAAFWTHVKSILAATGYPITNDSKLLDFGVGWGRLYKYLFREISPKNIVGFDVAPEAISLCREAMPFGDFQLIGPSPSYPRKYRDFDLIYLYSIFSHLSEDRFTAIVEALRDRLADNGCIAFTTLLSAHIDVWERQVNDPFYGPTLRKVGFDKMA